MWPIILFGLNLALVVVLIVVHETGHYVAGWMGGAIRPAGRYRCRTPRDVPNRTKTHGVERLVE